MPIAIEALIQAAAAALNRAYAPYSGFQVAAALQTDSDQLFAGVNVENASYPCSTCAENSAIAAMVSAGQRQIKAMVIMASSQLACPPCGACRQMIQEFSSPATKIYLCNHQAVLEEYSISDLLPQAFQFRKDHLS